MPFTIHASKDGERVHTQRITSQVAAEKARNLAAAGWDVYVTDPTGRHFHLEELDDLTTGAVGLPIPPL